LLVYNNGDGVDKDINKAIYWFKKSVERGTSNAQYNLAIIYQYGDGIDKDNDKAIYWYKKSAEQGNQNAQNKLEKISLANSCKIN